jgi:DNA-binding transcriptional MerR regulator
LLYDAKFVAMLEQLDLFATYTQEEEIKTTIKPLIERKLTPPAIVEVVEEQVEAAEELIVSKVTPSNTAETEIPATTDFTTIEPFPLAEAVNNNIETSDSQDNTESIPEENLKKRGRKSQKEMSLEAGRIDVPKDEILYSKQYYGIGEVASMFSVNTSLLRYWESEFDILKPRKNGKGDRFFRPDDIKNLLLIHHLLRERKYTIEGAKEFLKNGKKAREHFEAIEKLKAIKSFLLELKAGL